MAVLLNEPWATPTTWRSSFNWSNPPKTFFIDLPVCSEYTMRKDRPAMSASDCQELKFDADQFYRPVTEKLRDFPIAWDLVDARYFNDKNPVVGKGIDGAMLFLKDDGSVAYSSSRRSDSKTP
ncbi:MAG: hypothetical protein EON58_05655 [Alphaproteobacteria bacterium]|nr:MAG: hypothetical protein EON58_05655 [Alphaproteobacteria bacterium]